MKVLILPLLVLAGCTTNTKQADVPDIASATPVAEFSRSFSITYCNRKKKCEKPVTLGAETVSLKLEPYHKGEDSGLSGLDTNSVIERQVPIKSEIRVTKNAGTQDFYVYIMIRSGVTTAREGKVKTLTVKSLRELDHLTVEDDPIDVKGGTIRAAVVVTGND